MSAVVKIGSIIPFSMTSFYVILLWTLPFLSLYLYCLTKRIVLFFVVVKLYFADIDFFCNLVEKYEEESEVNEKKPHQVNK